MKDYHQTDDKIINNENTNYQRTNTINKTGETIPRMVDSSKINNNEMLNINKNEIKSDIPIINNTMYSFGDNNNNNNNKDLNLKMKYNLENNKLENRYQNISNIGYKSRSDLTDINPNNNNLLNNNRNFNMNEGRNTDNIMLNNLNNNITPSNISNNRDRKYKSEKRIYREKEEFYYNNIQNNPSDFIQNKEINKGLNTSSSDENDNGEDELKYQNNNNLRNNNYGNSLKNNNFRNFQMNEDINNNYYSKENYGDNEDRMMNIKREFNDIGRKGKNFNDNYNDSNQISNNYYK